MAAYKKPKTNYNPNSKVPGVKEDPTSFYKDYPSWVFNTRDKEKWLLNDGKSDMFWSHVEPFLENIERQTWAEILTNSSNNHFIEVSNLNKTATDRLAELKIEKESILSLRINGTLRLYGYMLGSAFCIVWFDDNHGDNKSCVCRSHKKHS